MPLKTQFQIVESPTQILEPTTKFGGQPVWINEPLCPLAVETGEQMIFLGQIALNEKLFPESNGTMVYLFFGGDSEPFYNEDFAAVIQSSKNVYTSGDRIEFISTATGSALFEIDENYHAVCKEYTAILASEENEDFIPIEERYTIHDLDYNTGFQFSKPELAGNKIGGQPLYIESLDNPSELFNSDEWLLLLQLAPIQGYWQNLQPNFYPFYMELGEFAILTIFIYRDYTQIRYYIQQP